jgi:hypothetical protein
MAHNPHAPQGAAGQQDPAGSTQMFRAFVDEEAPGAAAPKGKSDSRVGLIVTLVVVAAAVAGAAWLALA